VCLTKQKIVLVLFCSSSFFKKKKWIIEIKKGLWKFRLGLTTLIILILSSMPPTIFKFNLWLLTILKGVCVVKRMWRLFHAYHAQYLHRCSFKYWTLRTLLVKSFLVKFFKKNVKQTFLIFSDDSKKAFSKI